eukprot:TRINITY_DN17184_c0_g1_i1.p1 TRINITY_DN17184_c0_g1~~TRINITY_DN17184_c0_g1_i1.p1  ORF type:complete len:108 (+),score=58.20 TRINITY_DN17184_c0_g1_i1:74-397(+)
MLYFFFLMIRRPPRSTQSRSSAASDVYKRQKHYKELDTNGDGAVQREEFLRLAGVDRFSLVDEDQDGFISLKEYLKHDDHFYHTCLLYISYAADYLKRKTYFVDLSL